MGLAEGWRRRRSERKNTRREAVRGKRARQDSPAALEWTGRQAPGLQAAVGCPLDMDSPSVMVRRCHPESRPRRDEETGRGACRARLFRAASGVCPAHPKVGVFVGAGLAPAHCRRPDP